jgi:hypothetical protein
MIATESFVEQNLAKYVGQEIWLLLNIAMMDAAISCWMLNIPTLIQDLQADPSIKQLLVSQIFPRTFLDIPLLAAASQVLSHIIPSKEPLTKRQSKPLTRLYGAIHYRDCEQGLNLGKK